MHVLHNKLPTLWTDPMTHHCNTYYYCLHKQNKNDQIITASIIQTYSSNRSFNIQITALKFNKRDLTYAALYLFVYVTVQATFGSFPCTAKDHGPHGNIYIIVWHFRPSSLAENKYFIAWEHVVAFLKRIQQKFSGFEAITDS